MSRRGAHIRQFLLKRAVPALALSFCALAMPAGCEGDPEPPWDTFEQDRAALFGPEEPAPQTDLPRPPRNVIRLQVTSIQLPLGTAGEDQALWAQLDAGAISAAARSRLQANGFRVGVARRDSWSRVADALGERGARPLKTSVMVVIPGRPIAVPLGRSEQPEAVFAFRADGTLEGMDLPPGDTAISVNITPGASAGERMRLAALPQLRTLHDQTRFVKEGENYALQRTPEVISLYPLAWDMALTERDFLVVGPGADARRSSSPGHHFLLHEFEDRLFETLLVFAPRLDTADPATEGPGDAGLLQLPDSPPAPTP